MDENPKFSNSSGNSQPSQSDIYQEFFNRYRFNSSSSESDNEYEDSSDDSSSFRNVYNDLYRGNKN